MNESIYKFHPKIDPIIRDLLDLALTVNVDERPDATALLSHLNELELKYYGELVSYTEPEVKQEEVKNNVYGSPQSVYKVYNNNYLPPASLKSKKHKSMKVPNELKEEVMREIMTQDSLNHDGTELMHRNSFSNFSPSEPYADYVLEVKNNFMNLEIKDKPLSVELDKLPDLQYSLFHDDYEVDNF